MKSEDFEKFKKDKLNAEILEKKRSISRLTIRSKAAKAIQSISGKKLMSFLNTIRSLIPERSIFCIENSSWALSQL